jgi:YidC/Oxa1 family membrane protein insertase
MVLQLLFYNTDKIGHVTDNFQIILVSSKMKLLRPEIAELGEKFKKDPMKKQQETMKLYNKAGVNPGLYLRDSNAF